MAEPQTFLTAITSPPILASVTAGFVAGLLGGWIAHHLALSRDKRKEFNAAVQRVRTLLKLERDDPRPHSSALYVLDQIDGLNPLLGPIQRARLRHARAQYERILEKAPKRTDDFGNVCLKGKQSEISKCAAKLRRILKPR
jgi:hypothetical protein